MRWLAQSVTEMGRAKTVDALSCCEALVKCPKLSPLVLAMIF